MVFTRYRKRSMDNCPLCNSEDIHYTVKGKTFIYTCEECPFVGFEYIDAENLKDLNEYLKRGVSNDTLMYRNDTGLKNTNKIDEETE